MSASDPSFVSRESITEAGREGVETAHCLNWILINSVVASAHLKVANVCHENDASFDPSVFAERLCKHLELLARKYDVIQRIVRDDRGVLFERAASADRLPIRPSAMRKLEGELRAFLAHCDAGLRESDALTLKPDGEFFLFSSLGSPLVPTTWTSIAKAIRDHQRFVKSIAATATRMAQTDPFDGEAIADQIISETRTAEAAIAPSQAPDGRKAPTRPDGSDSMTDRWVHVLLEHVRVHRATMLHHAADPSKPVRKDGHGKYAIRADKLTDYLSVAYRKTYGID